MPRHDAFVRLRDVLVAADRIAEVIEGMNFDRYAADWKTQSIVER